MKVMTPAMAAATLEPPRRPNKRTLADLDYVPRVGRCRSAGCTKTTTEWKPYCIDHLGQGSAYLAEIEETFKSMAEEERRAKRGYRHINVEGRRSQDILEALEAGAVTIQRLQAAVQLKARPAANYIKALLKAGLVKTWQVASSRGQPMHYIGLSSRPCVGI